MFTMGFPTEVENVGLALQPAQWHYNPRRRQFRYRPANQTESARILRGEAPVIVPIASGLIETDGTRDLQLRGIQFQHSSWDEPSSADGYLERYGGVRFLMCNSSAAASTGVCYRGAPHQHFPPLPLIFSYKSDKSLCGAGADAGDAGCWVSTNAEVGCALNMAAAAVHMRSGGAFSAQLIIMAQMHNIMQIHISVMQ